VRSRRNMRGEDHDHQKCGTCTRHCVSAPIVDPRCAGDFRRLCDVSETAGEPWGTLSTTQGGRQCDMQMADKGEGAESASYFVAAHRGGHRARLRSPQFSPSWL
jgi:hypothetical protein